MLVKSIFGIGLDLRDGLVGTDQQDGDWVARQPQRVDEGTRVSNE